jgi:hypothetical protein
MQDASINGMQYHRPFRVSQKKERFSFPVGYPPESKRFCFYLNIATSSAQVRNVDRERAPRYCALRFNGYRQTSDPPISRAAGFPGLIRLILCVKRSVEVDDHLHHIRQDPFDGIIDANKCSSRQGGVPVSSPAAAARPTASRMCTTGAEAPSAGHQKCRIDRDEQGTGKEEHWSTHATQTQSMTEWNDARCFDSTLSQDICVVLRFMRAKHQ